MQTYCRESAPLVPREWSYEAENLQLYRYRQVLARMSKFSTRGPPGSAGPPSVNLGLPKISETTRARMLKLKTQLGIAKYSLWVQKFLRFSVGPHSVNLGPP